METKTSKTKLAWIKVCALALVMVSLLSTSTVFANGGGGAGGGSDGGDKADPGCLKGVQEDTAQYGKGTLTQYDSCGAGFRLYDVSNSSNWPNNQTSYINSNVVPVCSKFGGKFYFLSLHRVSLNSAGTGVVYSDKYSHRRQVYQLKSGNEGGSGHIPYVVKGGALAFADVLKDHQTAEEYAKKHPEQDFSSFLATPWTDVTWFCWNPEWEDDTPDKSRFSSKSKVTGSTGTKVSSNWGVDDAGTLEVEADASGSATVYFSHNLRYSNPNPDGKAYEQATTTGTITFDDGSGETYSVPFSADGASTSAEAGWQTSDAGIEKTITLADDEDEKTVCSTIAYTTKTVNWSNDDPHKAQPVGDTGSTKACAKITRAETEEVGSIEFWSRSHVESIKDNIAPDVVYHKASTYDNFSNATKIDGDEVTLRLSTDYTSAHATFRHDLGFGITLNDGITFGANDEIEYDEMCTNWEIHSGETSGNGATGEYCADTKSSGSKTDIHVTTNHTVNIGNTEGAEAAAAEKITFKKKKIPILRSEIKTNACGTTPETNNCSYDPKRWKYYAEDGAGSGEGSSAARIEYVRPTEPTGEGPSLKGNGSADGSPMYAGESSEMVWQANAEPNTTRRVEQYQAVAFLVPVNWLTSNAKTAGTYQNADMRSFNTPGKDRNRNDPCTFWRTQYNWQLREAAGGCTPVSSVDKTFPGGTIDAGESSVNGSASMAVPDWIGDKYCNSFGYKWGYYYGIKNSKINSGAWSWQFDNQTYWVHYNAACRTIAKKPSVAFWNGGLFAGAGNVATSTSTRRQNPFVGILASTMPTTQYGSWAEYLANVNGSVGGNSLAGMIPGLGGVSGLFSSGAAYAWDGSTSSNALSNSPLTIQNVNSSVLGYSGVSTNSAVMDRLEAYFKKAATSTQGYLSEMKNIGDSRIYYVNGNVEITGNIELSTASKSSIYQLPQVVIFATGDINISENVTQIDAWLISKQKVDTCYNKFSVGLTQARVNGNPVYTDNNCQEKLNINGPVFAKTITTKRSFGSDGTSNNDTDPLNTSNPRAVPAEVFNLSAESYLWAYAQAGRYSSSYTEAYSRELPPRY